MKVRIELHPEAEHEVGLQLIGMRVSELGWEPRVTLIFDTLSALGTHRPILWLWHQRRNRCEAPRIMRDDDGHLRVSR